MQPKSYLYPAYSLHVIALADNLPHNQSTNNGDDDF